MCKGWESYFVNSLGDVVFEDDFQELSNVCFDSGTFYRVRREFSNFFHNKDKNFEVSKDWLERFVGRGNVIHG